MGLKELGINRRRLRELIVDGKGCEEREESKQQ